MRKRSGKRNQSDEPRWSRDGVITPSGIWQLSFQIERDEDPHPDDVRAALAAVRAALADEQHYVAMVTEHGVVEADSSTRLPNASSTLGAEMTRFLFIALTRNLDGLSLDRAFGLNRKRGRSSLPLSRQQQIAAAVLERLLKGKLTGGRKLLDSAAAEVGAAFGIASSQAREYYRNNKLEGAALLRTNSKSWNVKKQKALDELLNRESAKARAFRKRANAQATPTKSPE